MLKFTWYYSTEVGKWFLTFNVLIADLVKKMEEQKAEVERQLKVFNRQMKVRKLLYNICGANVVFIFNSVIRDF